MGRSPLVAVRLLVAVVVLSVVCVPLHPPAILAQVEAVAAPNLVLAVGAVRARVAVWLLFLVLPAYLRRPVVVEIGGALLVARSLWLLEVLTRARARVEAVVDLVRFSGALLSRVGATLLLFALPALPAYVRHSKVVEAVRALVAQRLLLAAALVGRFPPVALLRRQAAAGVAFPGL